MTPFLNTRIELNENVRNSISVTSCGHLVTSLGSITMSVSCVDWFLVEEEPIRQGTYDVSACRKVRQRRCHDIEHGIWDCDSDSLGC